MKIKFLSLIIGLCLSGFAMADGDAAAGKSKAITCTACHGADGNSMVGTFPKLAGQNAKYLVRQMKDILSGARPVPTMAGMLTGKTDQDMADIAAFFESQEIKVGEAKKELVDLGERIYRNGNASIGVVACTACHSPTGSGNAGAAYPALGGQHAEYTAAQLKAFRDGQRTNEEVKIMSVLTYRLNDKEIEALASYISGLQ